MVEQLGNRPKAILLQECFLTRDELFAIKLQDYKPVVATAPDKTKAKVPNNPGKTTLIQRRASAIFVDRELHVQPLKERTKTLVELIGVRVVGDTRKTYKDPFDLWSVYCVPGGKEAAVSSDAATPSKDATPSEAATPSDAATQYEAAMPSKVATKTEAGEQLCRLLKEIVATSNRRVLLAGDFNADINFTRPTYKHCKAVRVLDEMDEEGQICILNPRTTRP